MSTRDEVADSKATVRDILAQGQTSVSDGLRLAAQALEILARQHAEVAEQAALGGTGEGRNSGGAVSPERGAKSPRRRPKTAG